MTTKEKYELIDKTKVSAKVLEILEKMEKASSNFTNAEVNSRVDTALDKIIEGLKVSKPEALLSVSDAKKEVKKEKKEAEEKNKGKDLSKKKDTDDKTGLPKKDTVEERKDIIKKESESEKEARERAKKELEKENEKAKDVIESQIEKLNRIILEDPALRGFNTGTSATGGGKSTPLIDAERKAIPRGRRVSQKGRKNQYGASAGGRVYWENRENRSDRKSPDYPTGKPYLEKGGNVYASEDLYEVKMVQDGVELDSKLIRARNKGEARMIFEDMYQEKYQDEFGAFDLEIDIAKDRMADGGGVGEIKVGDKVIITTKTLGKQYEGMLGEITPTKLLNDKFSIKLENGLTMAFDKGEFRHNSVNPKYAKGGMMADGGIIWSEIRSDFEDDGVVYIDGYETEDDNEEGKVIAKVKKNGEVIYLDNRAKNDSYAQEVIQEVMSERRTDGGYMTKGGYMAEGGSMLKSGYYAYPSGDEGNELGVFKDKESMISFAVANKDKYGKLIFEGIDNDDILEVDKRDSQDVVTWVFSRIGMDRKEANKKIKMWFISNYPADEEEAKQIDESVTFDDIWFDLKDQRNIYDRLRNHYVVREVFEKIASIYGVEYDFVEKMYKRESYAKGGYMADGGKVDKRILEKVYEYYDIYKDGTNREHYYDFDNIEKVKEHIEKRTGMEVLKIKEIEIGRNYPDNMSHPYYHDDYEFELVKGQPLRVERMYGRPNYSGNVAYTNTIEVKNLWQMADGGMLDDEGNLIDIKIGDEVVEYKKRTPNATEKTPIGPKGRVIKIMDNFAKVSFPNDYEENILLRDLKKMSKGGMMADGVDYVELINLIKSADNPRNLPIYYNSDSNVVNIGGVGYDKAELVKMFNARAGQSLEIKNLFYQANQYPQETKNCIESMNVGIEVEIGKGYGNETFVKYIKMSKGGIMANGGRVNTIELEREIKETQNKYPKAKVSYSFAKDSTGKGYVIRAKEGSKIVYSSYKAKHGGMMADGGYIESGEKLYEIANNMSDKEFQEAYRNLSGKEKDLYETLLRLGDEDKIALVTVLNESKKPKYDKSTWDLHRYAKGGLVEEIKMFDKYNYPTPKTKGDKVRAIFEHFKKKGYSTEQINTALSEINYAKGGEMADGGGVGESIKSYKYGFDTYIEVVGTNYGGKLVLGRGKIEGVENVYLSHIDWDDNNVPENSEEIEKYVDENLDRLLNKEYAKGGYMADGGEMNKSGKVKTYSDAELMEKFNIDRKQYLTYADWRAELISKASKEGFKEKTNKRGIWTKKLAEGGETESEPLDLNESVYFEVYDGNRNYGIIKFHKSGSRIFETLLMGNVKAGNRRYMSYFTKNDLKSSLYRDFDVVNEVDEDYVNDRLKSYEKSKPADILVVKYPYPELAKTADTLTIIKGGEQVFDYDPVTKDFTLVSIGLSYPDQIELDDFLEDSKGVSERQYTPELIKVIEVVKENEDISEIVNELKSKGLITKYKYTMADGGEVDFNERMAKMRNAYDNLEMIVKGKIASAIGIDEAVAIMDTDYSIDPFRIIIGAVRGGLLELDEINKDLINSAVDEAEEVTEDYRDSGQGIGSSDMTYFTQNVLNSAGYKTGFINNTLKRVDADGNELVIDKYEMKF